MVPTTNAALVLTHGRHMRQRRQWRHPCRRDHLLQPHAQLGALLMREAISRDHLLQPHAQLGALLMREAIRGNQRQSAGRSPGAR
jgi:hypothetical protein